MEWPVKTSLSPRFTLYTRANIGEVFPDPVVPLTMTLYFYDEQGRGKGYGEMGFRDAHVRLGSFEYREFPDDQNVFIGITGGYAYLNGSIFRIFGERAPGLSAQAMDEMWFGAQPGIPPYVKLDGDDQPHLTEKLGETFGWCMTVADLPELDDDEARIARLRADRPDIASMSDEALVARMRELMGAHFRQLFARHIFFSLAGSLPVGAIQQFTAAVGEPGLALTLLGGLGDVASAKPSVGMWRLGRLVAASPALMGAFDAGLHGLLERVQGLGGAEATAFLTAFGQFIYEFGSRGPNEWEMRSPNWETNPELALAAIDRMRLADASADPAGHNASMAALRLAATAIMRTKLAGDPDLLAQFEGALRAGMLMLPARERCKTTVVRMIQEARLCMYELGRRMVGAGHFDAVDDFGFLRDDELDAFLADPAPFRTVIRERAALMPVFAGLREPFVFDGEAPPTDQWRRRGEGVAAMLTAGETLTSFPGCPGKATGRARVVLDSFDPTGLQPGDVLVAPSTDPSWTPLFVPAAAVVVDVGAAMSHAVIVSRELGIPCVVSATDATRRIRDGDLVEVDGDTGVVRIVG